MGGGGGGRIFREIINFLVCILIWNFPDSCGGGGGCSAVNNRQESVWLVVHHPPPSPPLVNIPVPHQNNNNNTSITTIIYHSSFSSSVSAEWKEKRTFFSYNLEGGKWEGEETFKDLLYSTTSPPIHWPNTFTCDVVVLDIGCPSWCCGLSGTTTTT